MADTKALPVFAYVEETQQLEELRSYINKLGGKLDAKGPTDVADNLLDVINSISIVGNVNTSSEVDAILSSVSSLFVVIPEARAQQVVTSFCNQLTSDKFKGTGWQSNSGAVVRVLSNLFRGFAKQPQTQQVIFERLIDAANCSHLIGEMDTEVATIESYLQLWGTDTEGKRRILRALHQALLNDHRADQAAKVMIALLGTYTAKDAGAAQADARECVRTAVVDPKSFSFDHLVRLDAVQQLQKSDPLMHEALELFTSGTLKDYQEFVKKNPTFVTEKLRVKEEVLVKKIRLLTMMSIAEKNSVIPLADLAKELDLADDEGLEEFIIDAIQVNAISAKVNEMSRTLVVSSFQHRSFGREQWVSLHHRLQSLIANLRVSHSNIKNVTQAVDATA